MAELSRQLLVLIVVYVVDVVVDVVAVVAISEDLGRGWVNQEL